MVGSSTWTRCQVPKSSKSARSNPGARSANCVLPLTLTNSDVFATVRRFLMDSHYDEAAVCERLNLTNATDYLRLRPNPASPYAIRDSLDALVRLFLIGEIVEQSELEPNIPAAMVEALA